MYHLNLMWLMSRAYPALIKIAREEGVGAWYRGFAPKVLRLGPGGGVLLLGKQRRLALVRSLISSRRSFVVRVQETAWSPLHLEYIDLLHTSLAFTNRSTLLLSRYPSLHCAYCFARYHHDHKLSWLYAFKCLAWKATCSGVKVEIK